MLDARGDVDEHQRGGVDVVLAHGDQARAAAHRRADEHGSPTAERGDDGDEVLDHDVLAVHAVGRPVGVAVAPGVEGDGVVAGRAQRLAGALPRVAGLAAAVLQQHERAVGIAPRVAGDPHAARARPVCMGSGVEASRTPALMLSPGAGQVAADDVATGRRHRQ